MPNPIIKAVLGQGPEQEQLHDMLSKYKEPYRPGETFGNYANRMKKPPEIPRPGIFMPDPPITGPPDIVQLLTRLMDRYPRIKQNVSRAGTAPPAELVEEMWDVNISPGMVHNLNFRGLYYPENKQLFVSPQPISNELEYDPLAVVPHELGHAAGYGETNARKISAIMKAILQKTGQF